MAALGEFFLFLLGGSFYSAIEVLWRGYTHPSMFVAGGTVLLFLDIIDRLPEALIFPCRAIWGGITVTGIELAAGWYLNLKMGLDVWDYSELPYSFMGQICPLYTLLWTGLSVPALLLCRAERFLIQKITQKG